MVYFIVHGRFSCVRGSALKYRSISNLKNSVSLELSREFSRELSGSQEPNLWFELYKIPEATVAFCYLPPNVPFVFFKDSRVPLNPLLDILEITMCVFNQILLREKIYIFHSWFQILHLMVPLVKGRRLSIYSHSALFQVSTEITE